MDKLIELVFAFVLVFTFGVVFVFAVVDLQICGHRIIPLQQPTDSPPSHHPNALHCIALMSSEPPSHQLIAVHCPVFVFPPTAAVHSTTPPNPTNQPMHIGQCYNNADNMMTLADNLPEMRTALILP